MMRVLGKYDLENAILFDDLMTLLENYGVSGTKSTAKNKNNTSLDKSNVKSELPEATGSPRPTTDALLESQEVVDANAPKDEPKSSSMLANKKPNGQPP